MLLLLLLLARCWAAESCTYPAMRICVTVPQWAKRACIVGSSMSGATLPTYTVRSLIAALRFQAQASRQTNRLRATQKLVTMLVPQLLLPKFF